MRKLLEVLHALVEQGNTVVVIEHNLEVIKTADHVIDLGPEGGNAGGRIIAAGTPEEVAETAGSYTGQLPRRVLAPRSRRPSEEPEPPWPSGRQHGPNFGPQHRKIVIEDVPDHTVVDARIAVDQDVAQRDDPAPAGERRRRPWVDRESLLTASPMISSCRSTPERSSGSDIVIERLAAPEPVDQDAPARWSCR